MLIVSAKPSSPQNLPALSIDIFGSFDGVQEHELAPVSVWREIAYEIWNGTFLTFISLFGLGLTAMAMVLRQEEASWGFLYFAILLLTSACESSLRHRHLKLRRTHGNYL